MGGCGIQEIAAPVLSVEEPLVKIGINSIEGLLFDCVYPERTLSEDEVEVERLAMTIKLTKCPE